MDLDEALTTTRAVRRRLDLARPVDPETVRECLRLATCAPNGGNRQDWRFLVLDDPAVRRGVARHYRAASAEYLADKPENANTAAARALADQLAEVPVLVLACSRGRLPVDAPAARRSAFYGSIYPAVWSFMLAARARGLGTALTTAHLAREREVAELLGIPHQEITQIALIPVAHRLGPPPTGPPARGPLDEVIAGNRWSG
ncbi:nitroreductase family protein [Saccharopolyspora sp. MS10]|uniref:nitroreductase family protein n=1 Tax=Saccharopolyspora sp. MS10 TaxID=3385973 RepID=UPI0039A29133